MSKNEDQQTQQTPIFNCLKAMGLNLESDNKEEQDAFWASEHGLRIAKELTATPPKRYNSTTNLKFINAVCMMLIEDGLKKGDGIPNTLCVEGQGETKITQKGFMTALFYQEGVAMGLKGRKLLDFVYQKSKIQHTFLKNVIAIHGAA